MVNVNGKPIHFARATILALYGDNPACVKSTMTGSACPTCFCPGAQYADDNPDMVPRTHDNMRVRRAAFRARVEARVPGDVSRARSEARKSGVNLDTENGWITPPGIPSCMGVDPDLDNVWANSPSLMLHAFDEGTVEKFCAAVCKWAIHDGRMQHGLSATEVTRQIDAAFALTYNERPLNSNVEVNGRDAFQLFPHGVVGYLVDKRRLNAKWYGPIADQLQFFLMGSNLLTPRHKKEMADLAHMIREIHFMLRQPVAKAGGVEEYQAYIDRFIQKLIAFNMDHTRGRCKSIKYHCARHWGNVRRQLGAAPMEYSLERALGDHFTRFWGLTNHGRHGVGKDMQMAAIVHRHSAVADLCHHANICSTLRQCKNTVDHTTAAWETRHSTVALSGKTFVVTATGMTQFKFENRATGLLLGIKLRHNTPEMVFPVVVSNTMRIPMQNRTVPMGAFDRVEVLTLRARPKFFGKKRYDNIMLLIETEPLPDGREEDIVYGRCCAFFEDKAGNHFVAVHWYDKVANSSSHFNMKARLGKVQLAHPTRLDSFDIVPVGAILNGALLVRDRGMKQGPNIHPQYWVRQSPREYNFLLDFYGERPFRNGETKLQRDRL
jgi:hypothetical protein